MNTEPMAHGQFVLENHYPVPPARVFAAWADPELKARWFIGPAGWSPIRRELDFRVGGEEVLHGRFDNFETLFVARYHAIETHARLVYVYDMHVRDVFHSVSLATVEFFATATGTRQVFTEQVAFLDGTPNADGRKTGTAAHFERIGKLFEH